MLGIPSIYELPPSPHYSLQTKVCDSPKHPRHAPSLNTRSPPHISNPAQPPALKGCREAAQPPVSLLPMWSQCHALAMCVPHVNKPHHYPPEDGASVALAQAWGPQTGPDD
jgi:hypothetical protein